MQPTLTTASIQTGTVLGGRYEVISRLGKGGFGSVYRCRDLNFRRVVAVKILFASLRDVETDPELRAVAERFKREFEIMASLKSAAVVRVFDAGILQQTHQAYIVMEHLEGVSLRQHLRARGPMAPDRLLPHMIACLRGLGEAHERGIVHRDLNPNNLFLCDPGTRGESMRVLDFGIARAQTDHPDPAAELTATNSLLGTSSYYAPEYITDRLVTPALDVYQMGLILLEALTGQRVVDEPDPLLAIMRHRDGDLRLPSALPGTPIGQVIMTALHLRPERRYPSGYAFADALMAVDPHGITALAVQTGTARASVSTPRPRIAEMARVASTDEHAAHDLPTQMVDTSGSSALSGPSTGPRVAPPQGAPTAEAAATHRSTLPLVFGVVSATLALLLVSLAAFHLATRPGPEGAPAATEARTLAPSRPAPPQPPAIDPSGAQAPAITVVVTAEPSDVILTTPAGAHLGGTPYTFEFSDAKDEAIEVLASHDGYAPQTILVTPALAPTLSVTLDPAPPPTVPAARDARQGKSSQPQGARPPCLVPLHRNHRPRSSRSPHVGAERTSSSPIEPCPCPA